MVASLLSRETMRAPPSRNPVQKLNWRGRTAAFYCQSHERWIRPVLPGGDGVRSVRRTLDADHPARAVCGQSPLQRDPPISFRCISRALLARRLRQLETAGIVTSAPGDKGQRGDYQLTEAGREFRAAIDALGTWGQRWTIRIQRQNLDAGLLMWNVRRRIALDRLPERRVVVHFKFTASRPRIAVPASFGSFSSARRSTCASAIRASTSTSMSTPTSPRWPRCGSGIWHFPRRCARRRSSYQESLR